MIDEALPSGWCLTTLGEAFRWGSGGTPKSGTPEFYGGLIPWVIIGDLNDGLVSKTASRITQAGLDSSSAKWVEEGSVLLAMYGSIGKLGIAATRLTTNQAIAFTKPNHILGRYLFWYLFWQRDALNEQGKGDTQANISQTVIKAFPFLVAPLPEQRRIVAEIEKHLTRLDAAVVGLERVRAKLKRYRASVLKAACEGRLVPTEAELARAEGRDYEPASVLLERILEERRARWGVEQLAKMRAAGKGPKDDGWKARYLEPVPPVSGDLRDAPEGWCWTTTEQLSDETRSITYGVIKLGEQVDGGVPVLRSSNVRHLRLDLSRVKCIAPQTAAGYKRHFSRAGKSSLRLGVLSGA